MPKTATRTDTLPRDPLAALPDAIERAAELWAWARRVADARAGKGDAKLEGDLRAALLTPAELAQLEQRAADVATVRAKRGLASRIGEFVEARDQEQAKFTAEYERIGREIAALENRRGRLGLPRRSANEVLARARTADGAMRRALPEALRVRLEQAEQRERAAECALNQAQKELDEHPDRVARLKAKIAQGKQHRDEGGFSIAHKILAADQAELARIDRRAHRKVLQAAAKAAAAELPEATAHLAAVMGEIAKW